MALHISVFNGQMKAVETLVVNGADVNALDSTMKSPLTIAAERGFLDIAAFLIRSGSRVNHRDQKYYTPLMHAAKRGFLAMVELLHQNGAELTATEDLGQNALHLAAEEGGDPRVFAYLAFHGVPVKKDLFGYTSLDTALREDVFRSLVFSSGMVYADRENLGHILSYAADRNDSAFIKRFCRSLPPSEVRLFANRATWLWGTPLCQAAGVGSVDCSNLLMKFGAEVDLEGCAEGTPLMLACACGRLDMVKFLVRNGAKIEYTNDKGDYRNAMVAAKSHPHIVEWFLRGRFQEQGRLEFGPSHTGADVRHWSGVRTLEYRLQRTETQRWGEPLIAYLCRKHQIKESYKGEIVHAPEHEG